MARQLPGDQNGNWFIAFFNDAHVSVECLPLSQACHGRVETPQALFSSNIPLPAVYYRRYFVASGGLISYGPDVLQQFRGRPAT
jgi:hypothetical protein